MVLAAVLAGGEGLRLRPIVRKTPKALVKIAGRPLYRYSLDEVEPLSRKVVVIAPPGRGGLFTEARRVVEQPAVGSLDSAIRVVEKEVDREGADTVVLSFTGFLSAPRGIASAALDYYYSSGYQAVLAAVPVATGLETYGFLDMKPTGEVEAYLPPGALKKGASPGYVFAGVLAASKSALETLARQGFEAGLSSLAGEGTLGALVWHGDWVEIGYPWDLLEARRVALELVQPIIHPEARIGRGASIEGRVTIEKGARISSGAVIEGPAYIGSETVIEPGSHIAGSLVERGSHIGYCASLRETVVLEGALVGHHSYLEMSIVGPNAVVGAYTMAEAGQPREIPARLAGLEKLLRVKPRVGAAIGEDAKVAPRSSLGPGALLDKERA